MSDIKYVVSVLRTAQAQFDINKEIIEDAEAKTLMRSASLTQTELMEHMAHLRYQKPMSAEPFGMNAVIRTKGIRKAHSDWDPKYYHLRFENVLTEAGDTLSGEEKARIINAAIAHQLKLEAAKEKVAAQDPYNEKLNIYPATQYSELPYDPKRIQFLINTTKTNVSDAREIIENLDEDERISFNMKDRDYVRDDEYYLIAIPRHVDFYADTKSNRGVRDLLEIMKKVEDGFALFMDEVKGHNSNFKNSKVQYGYEFDEVAASEALDYVEQLIGEMESCFSKMQNAEFERKMAKAKGQESQSGMAM